VRSIYTGQKLWSRGGVRAPLGQKQEKNVYLIRVAD
jgi:hypothetical protein